MIHVGDCRDVLTRLPAGFADCCITDPPYGETSLDWDVICDGWIGHVARALKPACSIWVFGSMRYLMPIFSEMEDHGFRYSQDIVWEKHNGSSFQNDRFRRVHEHAVMFYRGAWSDVYHDVQFTNDATARTVRRKSKPAHWTGARGDSFYATQDGGARLMRSVIHVRSEHGRAVHPTQKPVELLMPLVQYSCPPGGTVLDCFAGSGSTEIAAKILGRKSVLIEIDPGLASVMTHRISNDAPLMAGVV